MRFSSILLLVSLALPLSALADMKTADTPGFAKANATVSTNFSKLENLFNTGSVPDFENPDLVGFAGRCFVASQENAVKGAAYLTYEDATRNGPIDHGRNIMSIWNDNLAQYDLMPASAAAQGGKWSAASVINGSIATALDRNTGSFLRMNGDYYIEKIAGLDGAIASYYCYYYITLAP